MSAARLDQMIRIDEIWLSTQPMDNRETLVDIYAAVAEALNKWEDRLQLQQVDITSAKIGQLILSLTGKYVLDGKVIKIDGIVIQ